MKKEKSVQLHRVIGYFHGTIFLVSMIIGAGIFVSPRGVLKYSSLNVGVSLIIWAVCALVTVVTALSVAELGTTFPKSGALYYCLKRSLGPFIAFLFLWVELFNNPASIATRSLFLAGYVIQPFYSGCSVPEVPKKCLALAILLCLGILNIRGVKDVTWFQTTATVVKMTILCIISVTGIMLLVRGRKENTARFENAFDAEVPDALQVTEAFFQGLYAYSGWAIITNIAGELKNPTKNIPKCVVTSLTIVSLIYLLVNISYLAVLTPEEIVFSDAVAVTWMDKVIPSLQWAVSIGVSASIFSSLNCSIFSVSRILFAASQEGQLPLIYSTLNMHSCPAVAVIHVLISASIMIFPSDVLVLINYVGFTMWLQIGFLMVGLLKLRFLEPNLPRPYKVCLPFVFGTIAISLFLVLTPVIKSPNMHHIYPYLPCPSPWSTSWAVSGASYHLCCQIWRQPPFPETSSFAFF
ncbi:PREDICTED: solute carrier family 7 member 13-like [Elephantulus edwardii]|uniref:solute carrier family 7 member 13-like n=1 Tax=Elephantulus edwardii TaxID=28737 RepID=UPI0003F0D007|nr:PREDICTED: solute carrier family 7 member 13-like [Elephantulus edwardii]